MSRMPYSRKWRRVLLKPVGEQKASFLISRAQSYYDGYCKQYAAEKNRANWKQLQTRILPGLAIYNALLNDLGEQDEALRQVEVLFKAAFITMMASGIRLLNILPNPFVIVKPTLKLMVRNEYQYLPGSQEIIEDNRDCFALNVYRCYILDTLSKHNASELTALYCQTDDWLSEILPKIHWERTKTLGRGDDLCDFRWQRVKD